MNPSNFSTVRKLTFMGEFRGGNVWAEHGSARYKLISVRLDSHTISSAQRRRSRVFKGAPRPYRTRGPVGSTRLLWWTLPVRIDNYPLRVPE